MQEPLLKFWLSPSVSGYVNTLSSRGAPCKHLVANFLSLTPR